MVKFDPNFFRNHNTDGFLAVCDQGTSNTDNTITKKTSPGVLNGKFY